MRTATLGFVALLSLGLVTAGCAKKEMVKPDDSSASAVTTPPPAPTPPPAKTEPIATQTITQAPVTTAPVQETATTEAAPTLLERIFFDFDAFVLSQTARDTLSRNAEYLLKKQPGVKVQLEGHCDERGSDEYNLSLGEKRAKAARDYLVTLGVQAERISLISYGEEKPLDPGHTDEAWAKNRRVEFVIVK
ncbi:MAG: peptidoglycan-associated lipoprotein Pal [Desulfuromonadales bacterium]|nr:MAG: peptidoglycan-associated lipoprotein Pal [Desulfuromonadales bacterium]